MKEWLQSFHYGVIHTDIHVGYTCTLTGFEYITIWLIRGNAYVEIKSHNNAFRECKYAKNKTIIW